MIKYSNIFSRHLLFFSQAPLVSRPQSGETNLWCDHQDYFNIDDDDGDDDNDYDDDDDDDDDNDYDDSPPRGL